jgi:predicted adenylyl cyclase CyaB
MKNIEIKARCADLERARRIARGLGATRTSIAAQVDTYFTVPNGRLKLRTDHAEGDRLIFYRRSDQAGPKRSDFELVPITEAEQLRDLLADALGVRAEVHKRREVWQWKDVRIHLDEVDGLGTFIEFEIAVDEAHPEAACREHARNLLHAFGITESDLIAGSYADLLSTFESC